MGGRPPADHAGRSELALPRKRGLRPRAARPPGAFGPPPRPCGLFFRHPVQALAAGVDGEEPAGLLHADCTLADRAGPDAARHDPLRKEPQRCPQPRNAPSPRGAESRAAGRLRQVRAVRRDGAPESRAAPPLGRPAGVPHDPHHAHPDDKDRPGDGGALRRGGCLRRRCPCGQTAGPHHPAPARRGGPGLHRELLWPVALPARAAAEGRAGALHRRASGLSPLVRLRRAQPGTGPHPRGKASGRAGPASGRAEPGLLREKP